MRDWLDGVHYQSGLFYVKTYLIAGFNSNQGHETIDLLKPYLSAINFEVADIKYKGADNGLSAGIWATRSIENAKVGHEIAAQIRSEGVKVVLCAHSNGVAIMSYVVETLQGWGLLDLVSHVVAIHGALNRGYRWPVKVVNFYGDDKVLTIGANARRGLSKTRCFFKSIFGGTCGGSRWGSYGAHPDYDSPIAINRKTVSGHSKHFESEQGLIVTRDMISRFA